MVWGRWAAFLFFSAQLERRKTICKDPQSVHHVFFLFEGGVVRNRNQLWKNWQNCTRFRANPPGRSRGDFVVSIYSLKGRGGHETMCPLTILSQNLEGYFIRENAHSPSFTKQESSIFCRSSQSVKRQIRVRRSLTQRSKIPWCQTSSSLVSWSKWGRW